MRIEESYGQSRIINVRAREDFHSFKSKEDLTQRISKSVFVTNFPDQFSARDLWNVCNAYGKVVDVYIPLKKSKAAGNQTPISSFESSPAFVIDDSCIMERDLSCSLMGKIKDINALPNLYVIFSNEGFEHINIIYLGGFWVRIDPDSLSSKEKISKHTRNTFAKIVTPWGKLSEVEAKDDSSLPFKKLGVITRPNVTINDKIKMIVKGQNEVVTSLTDPETEQLAIKDELGFVIHLESGYINLQICEDSFTV
nr:hypothetical protein [Tanacetum cinerariifolium]